MFRYAVQMQLQRIGRVLYWQIVEVQNQVKGHQGMPQEQGAGGSRFLGYGEVAFGNGEKEFCGYSDMALPVFSRFAKVLSYSDVSLLPA